MARSVACLAVLAALAVSAVAQTPKAGDVPPAVAKLLALSEAQTVRVATRLAALDGGFTNYPAKTAQAGGGGAWQYQGSTGWTSGFFPGLLWQTAAQTGNDTLAELASRWTAGRAVEANNTDTHGESQLRWYYVHIIVVLGSSSARMYELEQ